MRSLKIFVSGLVKKAVFGAFLMAFVFPTTGCSTVKSEDVETGRIWATFIVDHHENDHVTAWAVFRTGGPMGRILELTGGDYIECNGTLLNEYYDPVTGYHWVRSSVAMDQDGLYVFDFIRPGRVISTTANMGEIPHVIGTDPEESMSQTDSLTVFWDASSPGHGVTIDVEGECIYAKHINNVDDNGEYKINYIHDRSGADDCLITVTVTRSTQGFVNFNFEGGYTQTNRKDSTTLFYSTLR